MQAMGGRLGKILSREQPVHNVNGLPSAETYNANSRNSLGCCQCYYGIIPADRFTVHTLLFKRGQKYEKVSTGKQRCIEPEFTLVAGQKKGRAPPGARLIERRDLQNHSTHLPA